MVQSPYNPQEVLSPLMKRLGRILQGRRDEGFDRMVTVVREELQVDGEHARRLVESLEYYGLVVYEQTPPTDRQEFVLTAGRPSSREALALESPVSSGAWRIGPSV